MTIEQTTATLITVLLSTIIGAFVGGGAVLVVADRMVKSVLASPLLMQQSRDLAQSWPAPVRVFAHDTAMLVEKATEDKAALAANTVTVTTTASSTPPAEPTQPAG